MGRPQQITYRKCLDCPATITIKGNRLRCRPCSDLHYYTKQQANKSRKRREKKAAVQALVQALIDA